MGEPYEGDEINGVHVTEKEGSRQDRADTLYAVLRRTMGMIFFPDSDMSAPLLSRTRQSLSENGPLFREACKTSGRDVLLWTRRGSPIRALFVISVGTIALITLTGLFVFMLFFLAATVNAVVICLLMSLAAAGGFLALFFACVTAVYIGALSVAVFVISTATFSAIVAVLITTGWIGFFCVVWLATKKSVDLAKHSLRMTGSAISAYSSAWHGHRHID